MAFERRRHARVKIESLVPVDLGRDNGGMVLDASEGGLRVRLVGPVAPTQVFRVVIVLTGKKERIEASGQIAWTDESRTRAGVQFIGLLNSSHEQIKEWLVINDPARSSGQEAPTTEPARAETTLPGRGPVLGAGRRC